MSEKLIELLEQSTPDWRDDDTLFVLDENAVAQANLPNTATIISNRYDIANQRRARNPQFFFNDFDLSVCDRKFKRVVYRVSKERPLNHHIFNQIDSQLQPGGSLFIAGKKSDGIKGYHKKLINDLAYSGNLKKKGEWYVSELSVTDGTRHSSPLDSQNYCHLRHIHLDKLSFWSKPGLYGWNKIDSGSELLAETCLPRVNNTRALKVLDLGCGYGYLSLRLLLHGNTAESKFTLEHLTATDNNATAIAACTKNLEPFKQHARVIADDCASHISENFDLIICNPPFHQGFDTNQDLSARFTQAARSHLLPGGEAYFVVNSFIDIEKHAKQFFSSCETVANNRSFKVLLLKP